VVIIFGGYLKSRVFIFKSRTIEELKQGVREETMAIAEEMTRRVLSILRATPEECVCEKLWVTFQRRAS